MSASMAPAAATHLVGRTGSAWPATHIPATTPKSWALALRTGVEIRAMGRTEAPIAFGRYPLRESLEQVRCLFFAFESVDSDDGTLWGRGNPALSNERIDRDVQPLPDPPQHRHGIRQGQIGFKNDLKDTQFSQIPKDALDVCVYLVHSGSHLSSRA